MIIAPMAQMRTAKTEPSFINLGSMQGRWRADEGVLNLSSQAPVDGDDILSWTALGGNIGGAISRFTDIGLDNLQYETDFQNGKAVIQDPTDGGEAYNYKSASGAFGSSDKITVIGVLSAPPANNYILHSSGLAGIRLGTNGAGQMYFEYPAAAEGRITATGGLFGYLSLGLYVWRFNRDVGGLLARKNGVSYAVTGDFSAQAAWGTQQIVIGTYPGVPAANQKFGEILVYGDSLSLTEIQDIEEELNRYWAIY